MASLRDFALKAAENDRRFADPGAVPGGGVKPPILRPSADGGVIRPPGGDYRTRPPRPGFIGPPAQQGRPGFIGPPEQSVSLNEFADPGAVPGGGLRPWERWRDQILRSAWFEAGDTPPRFMLNVLSQRPALLRAIQSTPELLERFRPFLPGAGERG